MSWPWLMSWAQQARGRNPDDIIASTSFVKALSTTGNVYLAHLLSLLYFLFSFLYISSLPYLSPFPSILWASGLASQDCIVCITALSPWLERELEATSWNSTMLAQVCKIPKGLIRPCCVPMPNWEEGHKAQHQKQKLCFFIFAALFSPLLQMFVLFYIQGNNTSL